MENKITTKAYDIILNVDTNSIKISLFGSAEETKEPIEKLLATGRPSLYVNWKERYPRHLEGEIITSPRYDALEVAQELEEAINSTYVEGRDSKVYRSRIQIN